MKAGWTTKRLGEVCEVIAGQSPEGKHFNHTAKGDPFYQGKKDFGERYLNPPTVWTTVVTKRAQAGDILMSVRAPVGPVNFTNGTVCIGRGLAAIRGGDLIDREFLFHQLQHLQPLISGREGAVFASISRAEIEELALSFPSLPEQRRIVALLDEAFAGLATASANAERNLDNARELFESHLAEVFSRRGDGWVERRLDEVCSITSTLVDPREARYQDLTHVGAGNIESVTGRFLELKSAREEQLVSGKFLFDESMVLYSKIRPYLRKLARPEFGGLCSADMYPLAPNASLVTRDFLFYLLLTSRFTDYAIQGSARAGMPKVNREHLFAFSAWFPDIRFQRELTAILDASTTASQQLVELCEQKQAALTALKRTLLQQAFGGNL